MTLKPKDENKTQKTINRPKNDQKLAYIQKMQKKILKNSF